LWLGLGGGVGYRIGGESAARVRRRPVNCAVESHPVRGNINIYLA